MVNPIYRALWFRRVGFNLRFGVKLGVLWAAEIDPPREFRGGKHFKMLINWLRRVNSPRVMYITLTDPEHIQAFKSGFGLLRWHSASGFSLR